MTTSSAPQVTREKEDGRDKIDDDSDPSDELYTDVNPEDTDSISSDTSDDTSAVNLGASRHNEGDQIGKDVDLYPLSLAGPLDYSGFSDVDSTVTDPPVEA